MHSVNHHVLADRALAAASKALATRFPKSAFAFVAGSIMRGEGTTSSDIDLVVVFPHVDTAWRESFMEDGFPVETFVQDPQTLAYFFENDLKSGCPVMIHMVASGEIIGPEVERAKAVQSRAAQALARGPLPLSKSDYDVLRYKVSDLADDLRGDRPPAEVRAIAAQIYQQLADLTLLGRGRWTGRGKWVSRLLENLDRDLASTFDDAFQRAAQGDGAALLAVADAELALHGGHCFAGYNHRAPPDARCVVQDWVS